MTTLKPSIIPTKVFIILADQRLVTIDESVLLRVRPLDSSSDFVIASFLVLNSASTQSLGADMVIGLPQLHQLEALISFPNSSPVHVKWANRDSRADDTTSTAAAEATSHHTLARLTHNLPLTLAKSADSVTEGPNPHDQHTILLSHSAHAATPTHAKRSAHAATPTAAAKTTSHHTLDPLTHNLPLSPAKSADSVTEDSSPPNQPTTLPPISECSYVNKIASQFSGVFAEKLNNSYIKCPPMRIELVHYRPISVRTRRWAFEEANEICEYVNNLAAQGHIEPSKSQYRANCRLVPKKNGKRRLVINYIPLNRATIQDKYPMPNMADLYLALSGAKFFSTLDATEGFHQILIHPDDRHLTTFATPNGLYQYVGCPFGFTNSPAVFQREMDNAFREGLRTRCLVYVDDILVFGKTEEEHHRNLAWVLSQCRTHNIKINPNKCSLFSDKVQFLGLQVSKNGIVPISRELDFLSSDKQPSDLAELQSLIGSITWYARFIPRFSETMSPLHKLLRNEEPFNWTRDQMDALDQVRAALKSCEPQEIEPRETAKLVEIHILPQSIDVACISSQGALLDRASKTLSYTEKGYTAVELNLLAMVLAYDKFGPILSNERTTFATECKELEKKVNLKVRPKRVENLLLKLPPDARPVFKMLNSSPLQPNMALKLREEPHDAVFYVDGACYHNGKEDCVASWAVYAPERPELSCSGFVEENPSNQSAEVTAGVKALQIATAHKLINIAIISDSKYLINAATSWINRWSGNDFTDCRGKPLANQKLMETLKKESDGLNIEWIYVKGHNDDSGNETADKMAKAVLGKHLLAFVRISQEIQREDEDINKVFETIEEHPRFMIEEDLLYHQKPNDSSKQKRLVVPKSSRHLLMQLAHDDQLYGGHLGCKKTTRKLGDFWWPSMSKDVIDYVRSCPVCQLHKKPKGPPLGLLHPIPVSKLFEQLHIDIIGPVNKPTYQYNRYIITAIDAYSRYAFAKAQNQVGAKECLSFLEEIISNHGIPERIVSDQGAQFTSHDWLNKLDSFGIKHQFTTPYHPEGNGMDERFNGSLVKIIKAYMNQHQTRWDDHLKWALFVYNTSYQDSIMFSPYEVLFGCKPRTPLNLRSSIEAPVFESRAAIRKCAENNSRWSKEKQKEYYDRHRQPFDLVEGQTVLIRQHVSLSNQLPKYAPEWRGPGVILKVAVDEQGEPRYVQVLDLSNLACKSVALRDVKIYHKRMNPEEEQIASGIRQIVQPAGLPNRKEVTPERESEPALELTEPHPGEEGTMQTGHEAIDTPDLTQHRPGEVVVDQTEVVHNGTTAGAPDPLESLVIDFDDPSESPRKDLGRINKRKQRLPPTKQARPPNIYQSVRTIDGNRDWLFRVPETAAEATEISNIAGEVGQTERQSSCINEHSNKETRITAPTGEQIVPENTLVRSKRQSRAPSRFEAYDTAPNRKRRIHKA